MREIAHWHTREAAPWHRAGRGCLVVLSMVLASARAQHVVLPAVQLSPSASQVQIVAEGELDLMAVWADSGVTTRSSTDGGATFGPEVAVARVAPDPWGEVSFGAASIHPAAIAGGHRFVLSGLTASTSLLPPLGLPPFSTSEWVTLYSDARGRRLGFDRMLATVSDTCGAPELGCSWLRGGGQAGLDVDDAADHRHQAFTTWDLAGAREGELWVVSATSTGRAGAPINLSRALLRVDGNEYDPAVVTDASGLGVWVAFLSQNSNQWDQQLARSTDGGASWSLVSTRTPGSYRPALDYARDTDVLVWAFDGTLAPLTFGVGLQTSADGGVTFGPVREVAVNSQQQPGGPTGPVEVAISRDASTIAVAYLEEVCGLACQGMGEVRLAISEDAGVTFQTHTVASNVYVRGGLGLHDVAISDSGDVVHALWSSSTGAWLVQAVR